MNFKAIFKEWRVIILIFALLLSYISINHQFNVHGVAIDSVAKNSTAVSAGIIPPDQDIQPTKKEIINKINSEEVNSLKEYSEIISKAKDDTRIAIETNKGIYYLKKQKGVDLGLSVSNAAASNIRKGLELQGGTRVLLEPEDKLTDTELIDLMDSMERRLNVYGLTNLNIRSAKDISGNSFIVVEIAGATKEEVKDLIASQGKFEAKIGDKVAFKGGKEDITFVCRHDGTCSRITECQGTGSDYSCRFEFEISLSNAAADRHAEITKDLGVNATATGGRVLDKTLDFYLDGTLVDSLNIAADLKGQKATRILITGPGFGATQQDAVNNAVKNRDKLQTVLITGSLPTKLDIKKIDTISPTLGEAFLNNAILVGLLGALSVCLVIFIRYRSLAVSIPMLFTVLCEIYIILGLAALFRYNLDLAAIAGIIASVGTGVDDQIVIADEILNKYKEHGGWKVKIKKAFFIILTSYLATVGAMIPLFYVGGGLLTGFALATIGGVTIGVLITRPAYGAIIKHLVKID